MGNGDTRFRSRKFILALSAFCSVTLMAFWGSYKLAEDAKDLASIMLAWGTPTSVVLGLYQHFNVKDNGR